MINTGSHFRDLARAVLSTHFGVALRTAVRFDPNARYGHPFDVASDDRHIVCECKDYALSTGGQLQGGQRQQIAYDVDELKRLPAGTIRYLVFSRFPHPTRDETLAEGYLRAYRSGLGPIGVLEIDKASGMLRVLRPADSSSERS